MLYRFALGLGLLLIGLHVGRETSRTRPARASIRQARVHRQVKQPLSVPNQKVSVH
jgi:hypothetical protein